MSENAEQMRARRRALIDAGICTNAKSHGPATRGQLCDACARRRTENERAPMDRERTRLFWEAVRDLYFSSGRTIFRHHDTAIP